MKRGLLLSSKHSNPLFLDYEFHISPRGTGCIESTFSDNGLYAAPRALGRQQAQTTLHELRASESEHFFGMEIAADFCDIIAQGLGLAGIGHNPNARIFCGEVIYDFTSFFWMESSLAAVHPIFG